MNRARHYFVLLGLVCLGFSWDDYVMPGFYLLAGLAAMAISRRWVVNYSPVAECGILVTGTLFGYLVGKLPGQTTHFAIGHGLAWIQVARMLQRLRLREKKLSLVIALFHVGVACTVVLDIRFTLILPAIIFLLPRALMEMEWEQFTQPESNGVGEPVAVSGPGSSQANVLVVSPAATVGTYSKAAPEPPSSRLPFNPAWFLVMAVVMVVFFVTFPRGVVNTPLRLSRAPAETGSLADAVMDPTRLAGSQAGRVVLQIQAQGKQPLGYLKCFSLVETDGIQWSPIQRPPLKRFDYRSPGELANYSSRRVRVKNPAFLGRILPYDGRPIFFSGNFFSYPSQNAFGGVQCLNMWNTVNNVYEYWLEPEPKPEPMFRSHLRIYTNHPPQSASLHGWLNQTLKGVSDPFQQAKSLESWFKTNYTYKLGAPALNRLNATEDFIFNYREGHCERFASALTMCLRMRGIPARVAVGYVPSSMDWFSGWVNVRFRDAHAWSEAWFPDKGWVQLDATPQASRSTPERNISDLFEDLDFAWYSHVANFDRPTQKQVFIEALHLASQVLLILSENAKPFIGVTIAFLAFLLFRRFLMSRRKPAATQDPVEENIRIATFHYARMLEILSKLGFRRQPGQTPMEYLAELRSKSAPCLEQISLLTHHFCLTRYGGMPMSSEARRDIQASLDLLANQQQQAMR